MTHEWQPAKNRQTDSASSAPVNGPWSTLPYIDEHCRRMDAPADAVWEGLVRWLTAQRGPLLALGASLLGSEYPSDSDGDLHVGSTVPAFHVARFDPHRTLALEGSHRFARYALTFRINTKVEGTFLCAESRADFPGLRGSVYRALVVGSGGHRIGVRTLLRQIRRCVQPAGSPECVVVSESALRHASRRCPISAVASYQARVSSRRQAHAGYQQPR